MNSYKNIEDFLSELMGVDVTVFKVLTNCGFSFYVKEFSIKFFYNPDSTIWGYSEKWLYEGELTNYSWINIDKDLLNNIKNLIKEIKYE